MSFGADDINEEELSSAMGTATDRLRIAGCLRFAIWRRAEQGSGEVEPMTPGMYDDD